MVDSAGYSPAGAEESAAGNRSWWDTDAADYLAEHGPFLADRCVWGPEGLDEARAGFLGDLAGRRVLEVGAGAAQCSAWVASRGATVVATDLSAGMLARHRPGPGAQAVPCVQADARRLPFADGSFDVVFSSYGALPFVADPERVMAETARVLRPGGRFAFSMTHPVRWAFPDDPGPRGLTASRSYFDTTPYVERDRTGRVLYAEHHRTLEGRVADVVGAGLVLERLVEPTWPEDDDHVWGGWSRLRGQRLPGTLVVIGSRPVRA